MYRNLVRPLSNEADLVFIPITRKGQKALLNEGCNASRNPAIEDDRNWKSNFKRHYVSCGMVGNIFSYASVKKMSQFGSAVGANSY